jgi:hypothetical protein
MRRRDVVRGAGGLLGLTALPAMGRTAKGTAADGYAPLGRVQVPGAAEAVVGDDGTRAYVAAETGFAVVDVSDPAAPSVLVERRGLLSDREDGPMGGIKDVKVDGDRLLVAGPANPNSEVPNGVAVFDVAAPADPALVGFHETAYNVHNCYLDGGVAYLSNGPAGTRVDVVDVGGDDPAEIARWTPTDHDAFYEDVNRGNRNVHDVYVQDGRAYLATWDAGTFVLDVSDPADPTYVTHVSDYEREQLPDLGRAERLLPPGNHHYAQPSDDGSLLAVGRESWDFENVDGGPGGITLWDVSDPADPVERATIGPERVRDETFRDGLWTTSHNFDLVGDRLYSSWYQAGLKIHDVSDPANPELLAWWRRPSSVGFWTAVRARDAVVASAHSLPTQDAPFEGLVVLPDRAGEQTDPPELPRPTATPTATPTAGGTDTPTTGGTDTPTPSADPTATPTDSPTPSADPATGDGFGPLAALAALGGAAWWRRRD